MLKWEVGREDQCPEFCTSPAAGKSGATHMTGGGARRDVAGALLGALVGLVASTSLYLWLNPVLERSSGLLRETQGFLWSAIPILTALGALAGRALARRRR